MDIHRLISPGLCFSIAIAFFFTAIPAQAGGYIRFGYGHYGYGYDHHAYGHAYGYSHPYYGLHSYYGYDHHYYGHHNDEYGYSSPYSARDDYSSSIYSKQNDGRSGESIGNGWSLLANNQAGAALTDFGKQAQASPASGGPKVGFALASAALDRLDRGVWAMRRALRIDPNALHYVTLNQRLNTKLGQIIRQYEEKLAYSTRDADTAFMLASLHYLRRNIEAARTNINQAMLARHVSTSTRNLKDLIDQEKQG